MGNSLGSLIVLGVIAVFLIIKLRSVLGTRSGFEGTPKSDLSLGNRPPVAADLRVVKPVRSDADFTEHFPAGSPDAKALVRMQQLEPSFDIDVFIKGARSAYEMILMAFENGTLDKVRPFLGPEVADSFQDVVKDRDMRGMTVQSEFIGVKELSLQSANLDDTSREAELTVRFVGELTRIVRDRSGAVLEGSAKDTIRQRDVWTFARVVGSNNPNWQLVATGD